MRGKRAGTLLTSGPNGANTEKKNRLAAIERPAEDSLASFREDEGKFWEV